MTADALRLDGLRVQASGRTLLDGIDLAIPERGLFGIVGPNGSGKTTLLRAALGLVRPREGRIALFGRAPGRSDALIYRGAGSASLSDQS